MKARVWSLVIAGGGASNCHGRARNCLRLVGWTPPLRFLFSSSPHFPPPVPGSVLFDPDQLQHAYSSFYHLFVEVLGRGGGGGRVDQRHLGQDRGSESYRGNSCMMWGQVIGVCGGRVGDSGTSCSRKVPVHQGEAFKVPHRALPRCPCGTRRSAFVGSLAPGPCFCVCFFLCILKSGTMTFPGPGVSCLIRYILPIN